MGRPVTLQPEVQAYLDENPDGPMPTVYPGSIVVPCGTPVYQGPRMQEAMTANAVLMFVCRLCDVQLIADAEEGDVQIADYEAKR